MKIICIICIVIDIYLYIVQLLNILKKQKNNIIYVSRYIFFMLAIISIFPHIIFIKSNHTWDGDDIEDIIGFAIIEIIINVATMVFMWICVKYKFIIKEDKFIIHKPFIGKREIIFNDIDKNRSSYQFITYRRKGILKNNIMTNNDEQLVLYLNNGTKLCINCNFFVFSGYI